MPMAQHTNAPLRDPRIHDLRGMRFGRLVVVALSPERIGCDTLWECSCQCGERTLVGSQSLKRGITTSCGCYRKEMHTTHGAHKSTEYGIWHGMLDRCLSDRKPDVYARYGGRGIDVCPEWLDFSNFYRDMGPRPNGFMTIERINNDAGYHPGNCRWATMLEQGQNRRNSRHLNFDGRLMTLRQIMDEVKCPLPFNVVNARICDGWSVEDALSYPLRKHRPRCAAA